MILLTFSETQCFATIVSVTKKVYHENECKVRSLPRKDVSVPSQFFMCHLAKQGIRQQCLPIPYNRNWFSPLPGMQEASMKLTESLHEVYEPDWYGREDVKMVGEVRAGWQRLVLSPHSTSPPQGMNHKSRRDTEKAAWNSTA